MHNKPHTKETKERIRQAKKGKPAYWKRRLMTLVGGVQHWQCGTCRSFFPKSGFYKNKRTLLGITSECKKCHTQTSIKSRNRENYNILKKNSEMARRARKHNSKGIISSRILKKLTTLFGSVCLKCGSIKSLQWDHIKPLSKKGIHCATNLQRLCRKCNEQKHTKYVDYRTKGQKLWVITFIEARIKGEK